MGGEGRGGEGVEGGGGKGETQRVESRGARDEGGEEYEGGGEIHSFWWGRMRIGGFELVVSCIMDSAGAREMLGEEGRLLGGRAPPLFIHDDGSELRFEARYDGSELRWKRNNDKAR